VDLRERPVSDEKRGCDQAKWHGNPGLNLFISLADNTAMTNSKMIIEKRAVEPFMKNGYVLACPDSRHATYIDPGEEAEQLLSWIDQQELELISIVNTHAHMDHICGNGQVKEVWDVPIYLHQEDEELYKALPVQASWFGMTYPPAPPIDYYLHPSQQLGVGDLTLKIIHTPGHSPGSVTIQVEEHLFCGDLIFAGSVGRTDLPGGSHEVLLKSIREKILSLGDDCILHPGHGPDTTVGQERRTNPFLSSLGE